MAMLEERIGRGPTTILLWLLVGAIGVVMVRTILNEGLVPLYQFSSETLRGQQIEFRWTDLIIIFIITTFIAALIALEVTLVFSILQRRQQRKSDTESQQPKSIETLVVDSPTKSSEL